MKPRKKKFALIIAGVAGLSVVTLLILNAFKSNLVFFYTPTEVVQGKAPHSGTFRVGGMVVTHSVKHADKGLKVSFVVTDLVNNVPVTYEGILPDLFREGQGVVVQGNMNKDHTFKAQTVLAKHDEKYMPPEAAAALKQASSTLQTPSSKND